MEAPLVSEVVEAPVEADQVPAEETQTEIPEPEVEDAAESVEEAAVEEPEQLETPEERRYTEAELAAERQRVASEAAQAALEWDRRSRQSENARRETEKARREQTNARLAETAETVLLKHGFSADQEVVSDLVQRFGNVRSEIDQATSQSDVELAMAYVTAPVLGDNRRPEDWNLTPGADAYARAVLPHLKRVIDTVIPSVQQGMLGDYIHKDELPKLVDAEIQKRNAKAREGKTNLKHVEGTQTDNSTVAERLDRIGTPRETSADRQWWNDREKARGR